MAGLPVQRYSGMESFLRTDTNVIQFRIVPEPTAVSAVTTADIETATAGKKIPTHLATVTLDIVFKAGVRAAEAAQSPDGVAEE